MHETLIARVNKNQAQEVKHFFQRKGLTKILEMRQTKREASS